MEREYYNLTYAQQILLFSQKYTIHKQVNNISTLVLVKEKLDLDILKEAIKLVYKRMDSLSLRMTKINKEVKQYFSEDKSIKIGYLDFRKKSFDQMEKQLYKIAAKRVSYFDKPMSEIYIIHSHDNRNGIFFKVSHFILDSWAISLFFKDILTVYQALVNQTDLPKPLYNHKDLLIEDLKYENSKQHQIDREFFYNYFSESEIPIFTHISGTQLLEKRRKKEKDPNFRFGPGLYLRTKAKNIMFFVDKEIVEKMAKYSSENKITMQSLVLLAVRTYLSKITYDEETLSFTTVVARRGTLKEKNSGGSRVHFANFVTSVSDDTTFKDAINYVCQLQFKIFRHIAINPLEQLTMSKEIFGSTQADGLSSMAVTFQPVSMEFENLTIETKWYGNGTSGNPLYLTIMDGDGSGGLKFYYEYLTYRISEETISKFHNFIINFIEAGIKNDLATIKQLKKDFD